MLTLVQGDFQPALLDPCWLAIAATDDDVVNQQVSDAAEARRIFCNVVDAPKAASFIMPSIIDRSPLMVAVFPAALTGAGTSAAREAGSAAAAASGTGRCLCRNCARG